MGDFGKVVLPIAAAIIVPYAGAAIAGALSATGTVATSVAAVSPWAVAANAGLAGLSQIGALQQQRSQAAVARARNDAERARLQREFEVAERKRKSDLRRSLAEQRARFGAGGISSNSGSAGAVLRGLQKQTDDASRDHLGSVRQQSAASNRISLLEESSARKRGQFQAFQKTISPFVDLLEERGAARE